MIPTHSLAILATGLLGLSVIAPSVRAQDEPDLEAGPSYKVTHEAEIAGWTVSSFRIGGVFKHVMMERGGDDGRIFRYFLGNGTSTLMIYDNSALKELPVKKATYWFSGLESGDTPPTEAPATTDNGLTSEQDALISIDVQEDPDILAAIAGAKAFHLKLGNYSGTYDLKGAKKAADKLLEVFNQTPPGEEVIVMEEGTPSVVWDLKLGAGESKIYQVPGKKGQTMKLSYLEDTRQGQMDMGKYSVEEGTENGISITFEQDRQQRVDVSNPTDKAMDFRIFLEVK
ncbi:hypothetical protein [Haloferula sargassicola]|uniref:Uncharacterized protein n=1 Tax=Haloferula sargassicola TaxID=490096 RepID=A0ABP9UTC1_9BACT